MKIQTPELDARVKERVQGAEARGLQGALNRLFGIAHQPKIVADPRGFKRVTQGEPYPEGAVFETLLEAYETYTGDLGALRVGASRVTQILNLPTWPSVFGSTLNQLLIRDYGETDYRWRDVVTSATRADNFHLLERFRTQAFGDLPEVDEDAPYLEAAVRGDEKYEYGVSTRGANLTVTRGAIIDDRVAAITNAVAKLGRAAWRTFARAVWNLAVNNATYGVDGKSWFHSDHGNVGAAALSVASLTAAAAAIFAQKEPGSDDRLGLSGPFLLVVPVELENTARCLNASDQVESAPNPWRGRFGINGERIFVNPLLADADDWFLFDVSGRVQIIEAAFLFRRQNPELFEANDEREGEMLREDGIVFKMRHEWGLAVADYRGVYKAEVA